MNIDGIDIEYLIDTIRCQCYYELIEVLKDPDFDWESVTIRHSHSDSTISKFTTNSLEDECYDLKEWKLSDWYYDREEKRILHRGECYSDICFLSNDTDIRRIVMNVFTCDFKEIIDTAIISERSILKQFCRYKYRDFDPIYKILFVSSKYFMPIEEQYCVGGLTRCCHFKNMNLQNVFRENYLFELPDAHNLLSDQVEVKDMICPFSSDEEFPLACYTMFLFNNRKFDTYFRANCLKSNLAIVIESQRVSVKNDIIEVSNQIVDHDPDDSSLNNPIYKIHNLTEAVIAIGYIASIQRYDSEAVLKQINVKSFRNQII